jgi:RNA polymerase sigma factor (sigma-70 family)
LGWTEVADVTNEELVVRIKAGIDVPENMLQLWEQTRAFIHTVALHYQGYADLEDLEQEGYLALYDAVDGYEPESGCKFLSYAKHWMRQRMKRYIDNCCQTVRVPGHEQSRLHQYRKMVNAFLVHLGRRPTEWEVTHNLNLDEKQRRDLESAMRAAQIGSLDAALQEGEDGDTVGDMVTCSVDVEMDALDRLQQEQLQAVIWPMVDRLPGRQPDVIRKRYQEGMTLKEIGEAYGVNLNAIRQSERDGLRALRRSRDSGRLRAFLPELLEPQAYRRNGIREFDRTWESSTERVAMKLAEKCH